MNQNDSGKIEFLIGAEHHSLVDILFFRLEVVILVDKPCQNFERIIVNEFALFFDSVYTFEDFFEVVVLILTLKSQF